MLESWNDGAAKSAIVDFVARVTKEGGPDYVPPAERIATFDNDGTLWCEQPMPVQAFFVADRVRELRLDAHIDLYGPGTHNWNYWQRELHRAWPLISNGLGLR